MSENFSFYVQLYFRLYLMKQHNYGSNTISSYRDTFRLLLAFMADNNADISKINIDDISHDKVLEFMTGLSAVKKRSIHKKCKAGTYKIVFSICNDDSSGVFRAVP